jgi:hypothetical protein
MGEIQGYERIVIPKNSRLSQNIRQFIGAIA